MDMKLEVLVIPVSDVDRAKAFYEKLGFRMDVDYATPNGDYRIIQSTPPNSEASIIFGKGVTNAKPGSIDGLVLAVHDIVAARRELISQGVDLSEVFHDAGGGLGAGFYSDTKKRAPGPDPERRSYASYASFSDPDGNGWLLQELQTRLPGREWEKDADIEKLSELLYETAQHHGSFENSAAKHNWWDWYAPYLNARQNGNSSEEATAAADRHMDEVHHIRRQ